MAHDPVTTVVSLSSCSSQLRRGSAWPHDRGDSVVAPMRVATGTLGWARWERLGVHDVALVMNRGRRHPVSASGCRHQSRQISR